MLLSFNLNGSIILDEAKKFLSKNFLIYQVQQIFIIPLNLTYKNSLKQCTSPLKPNLFKWLRARVNISATETSTCVSSSELEDEAHINLLFIHMLGLQLLKVKYLSPTL